MMNQQKLLGVPTIRTQNFHLFRHSIGTVGIPANNGHQPLLPINFFPIGQIVEVVCLLCQILCQREGFLFSKRFPVLKLPELRYPIGVIGPVVCRLPKRILNRKLWYCFRLRIPPAAIQIRKRIPDVLRIRRVLSAALLQPQAIFSSEFLHF